MAKTTGAQNAVIGDNDGPTELPVSVVKDQTLLAEEKEFAKLARSSDYPIITKYLKGRMEFFQKWLPDGTEVRFKKVDPQKLAVDWIVATNIINEFQLLVEMFENTKQAVEEDARREDA